MKRYRRKMRENKPEQWEEFKTNERHRLVRVRREMSTDVRKRYNEMAKLRMRKYRENQKKKNSQAGGFVEACAP